MTTLTTLPVPSLPALRPLAWIGRTAGLLARVLVVGTGLSLAACGDDGPEKAADGSGVPADTAAGGGAAADINPAMAITHPLGEITLGDPSAPVVFVEYASYTCGHCAAFHAQNLPQLKAKYIETGKVFYVFREYPLDPVATAASMLARCVPADRYLKFADILFARQAQWAFTQDPRGALAELARQAGIGAEKFEACLTDQTVLDGLREVQMHARDELKVEATPTLFINSDKIDGNLPWPALEAIVQKHLPADAESADQEG